jgi:hypothetical protein
VKLHVHTRARLSEVPQRTWQKFDGQ